MRIPININDDYYQDHKIPFGKEQNTYAYVDSNKFTLPQQDKILAVLLTRIKENKVRGQFQLVVFSIEWIDERRRSELVIKNLTHKKREQLVKLLNFGNLMYNDIPIEIYSKPGY